ncbi:IS1380 family transposase, partial [Arthrospira platensis SPKY1]|nr:IS1380 family transposase [Arthrospira platensis SPKY1]
MLPVNFQKRKSGGISDRDCLLTMTGILCNARADFNDVDQYKDDRVFSEAFGIKDLPSEPTLRQRLDDLPPERTQATLRKLNLALLKDRNFKTVRAGHLDLVPVDIDVSPFDNSGSNKQGVSLTYKKHLGFAPIFAYIGAQ